MPEKAHGLLINIVGFKRQGKSTLAFYFACRESLGVAIFDPCAQFAAFPGFSDMRDFCAAVEAGQEPVVVYVPRDGDVGAEFSVAGGFMRSRQSYALIVDEASELQTPQKLDPVLSYFIRQAHRDGVTVVQTAHRPQDLHNRGKALADITCFFHTHLEADLSWIADQCGEEVAEKVRSLPIFDASKPLSETNKPVVLVYYQDGQRYEVWDRPVEWFTEIHQQKEESEEEEVNAT